MWAAWYAVGWTAVLPGFLVFAATTAVLFFADLDKMIIPNRIIYPGGLTATVLLGIGAGWMGLIRFFWQGLLAGLVYFLVFFGVFMVARGGFGFGDVRLAALLGTFTGFLSWTYFLAAIFYTGMAGGVVALIALLAGKGRKFRLPYGPLMILGAWASFVFARLLVNGV
jgi:leader peptidase (prepilin peptidase)/N-methyltransferase